MKNILTLFLVIFFVGCGYSPEDEVIESGMDLTVPAIAEVTAIVSPIRDSTPDYTFSSTENGTTTYGGSCSSNSTVISSGNNTITFNTLSDATYSDCTIIVADWALNESNTLDVSEFTVDVYDPTASVTTATITISENASVRSTETGTAYMVNTSVSVDNVTDITSASDSTWNSVTIESANTNTNMPASGLTPGTYKVYAVDAAGNFSNVSTNSVTVANPTVTLTSDTITTSENAVVRVDETGTAYLVNTSVSVSSASSITSASGSLWNSVSISSADTNTNLSASGLNTGTYVAYAIDGDSNFSSVSSDNVTIVEQMGGSMQGNSFSLSTVVTTLAGSSSGNTNATGTSARFNNPRGITTDGTNLYVADRVNHRIRKIVISSGVVTTLAGSSSGSTDATGTSASFNAPIGITTDGNDLYVVDQNNHRIRKID